jgi:hypothetical protein
MVALSCSKDDRDNINYDDILGIWYQEEYLEEYDRISRLEYNFREDQTLEVLRIEIKSDSRNVLGYRFRTLGNYELFNNQISFFNLICYGNNDTKEAYTELENLELVDNSVNDHYTVTCKIEDSGKKIIFIYPPCGPTQNCIGSKTLLR